MTMLVMLQWPTVEFAPRRCVGEGQLASSEVAVYGGDRTWRQISSEQASPHPAAHQPTDLNMHRVLGIRAGRHSAMFARNVRLHPRSVSCASPLQSGDCAIGTEYPQMKQASSDYASALGPGVDLSITPHPWVVGGIPHLPCFKVCSCATETNRGA
jgi:hypothetical protein